MARSHRLIKSFIYGMVNAEYNIDRGLETGD